MPVSVIHIAPCPDSTSEDPYGTQCALYFNKTGEIDYVGYATDEEFINTVNQFTEKLEKINTEQWNTLWNLSSFVPVIEEGLRVASEALNLPELPVQVFLFPWSGESVLMSDFRGVNALAPHESVIHLYINPKYYNVSKSVKETIVHEFTHLYYYQTSSIKEYSLYEHILMEGIAEVFREEVIGGEPAPWSIALDKKQAEKLLIDLKDQLSSNDVILKNNILFGGGEYKKWAGYSIGYHIVKEIRELDPDKKWEEIIARFRTKR